VVPIAKIDKGHLARLQVGLMSWRDQKRAELRDATAVIAGTYFPTSSGVTIDVARLAELIEALREAETEAKSRGWL
jgi:hypothetical protein